MVKNNKTDRKANKEKVADLLTWPNTELLMHE
jgi:hypothetical protein